MSAASSCSRDRTSRARHSCSVLAIASSDSRADPRQPGAFEGLLRPRQAVVGRRSCGYGAVILRAKVSRFNLETTQGLGRALALSRRSFESSGQCRHGVHHGIDFGARAIDLLIGRLNCLLRLGVLGGRRLGRCGRLVARSLGVERCRATLFKGHPLWLTPAVQRRPFEFELVASRTQHVGLLRVQRNLLLSPVHLELAGMRGFSRTRGRGLGFGQLDPHPSELVLDLRQACGRASLVLAGFGQPSASRLDHLSKRSIAPREQDLLPTPHFVAKAGIAPRFGRLTLERSALFLDLVNDVIDTRQVLLRRLQLELGGPATRFVLGDPGGFFDQLSAVGRPRAENHPDLALLDDGVGFGAQPGVHQQLVNVS